MVDDESLLKRFLLDDLSEEERGAVEARIFADDAFFETLSAHEEALIGDYLRDRLPRAERERFQRKYFSTPEFREKVEFVRSVMAGSRRDAWGERLRRLFAWPGGAFRLVAATAAVLAVGALVWLGMENGRLRTRLAQVEGQRTQIAREAPRRSVVVAMAIAPGLTRDAARHTLLLPPDATEVRLELETDAPGRFRGVLRAVDGGEVWSGELTASQNHILVFLAPELLKSGDYILTINSLDSSGEHYSYAFRAVRR